MLGEQLDDKVKKLYPGFKRRWNAYWLQYGDGSLWRYCQSTWQNPALGTCGDIQFTKSWTLSWLKRMGFVKCKATTKSTPIMSAEEITKVKAEFLKQVTGMVQLCNIPESLIVNQDQTGVKLVCSGDWTMAAEGIRLLEEVGLGDKWQIQLHLWHVLIVIFGQCRFYTKEKLIVHTKTTCFLKDSPFSYTQSLG